MTAGREGGAGAGPLSAQDEDFNRSRQLEKYCPLDTDAMILILAELDKLAWKNYPALNTSETQSIPS